MYDIFISYSRKDKSWVDTLASSLKELGYQVWWDPAILPGQDFEKTINFSLNNSKCVITVWSQESVKSDWVKEESSIALKREALIPVLYQNASIPLPFGRVQTADLQNWNGDLTDINFQKLLTSIESACKKNRQYHFMKNSYFYGFLSKLNKKIVVVMGILIALFLGFYKSELIINFQRGNDSFQYQLINSPGSIVGDTSTSAQKRYDAAILEIKKELIMNINQLSMVIYSIDHTKPYFFNDIRRINESELDYQDRAKIAFRDYISSITDSIKIIEYKTTKYDSFQRDLLHKQETMNVIDQAYQKIKKSLDILLYMESQFNKIISQNDNDTDRIKAATLIHKEVIAESKSNFFLALANILYLINEDEKGQLILGALLKETNFSLSIGLHGYKNANKIALEFNNEKSKILEEKIAISQNKKMTPRTINDPYLIEYRKLLGLPSTLSEDELKKIQSKGLDKTESDVSKLIKLSGLSFYEADGSASLFYFNRIIDLTENKKEYFDVNFFSKKSIERLLYPEKYEGGIGYMIINLMNDGVFSSSGLKENDVIFKINDKLIADPLEISSLLSSKNDTPLLVQVFRNGEKQIIPLKEKGFAGAKITSLILYNPVQL